MSARDFVSPRPTDKDKMAHFDKYQQFLSIKEPQVGYLADLIHDAIEARVNVFAKPGAPNITKVILSNKPATGLDILNILLQLKQKAPLLLNKPLVDILRSVAVLQETALSYCGIYVAGFVKQEADGTYWTMTVRDAIRIASICFNLTKLENVLKPIAANEATTRAAVSMATVWIATIRGMGLWADVEEFAKPINGYSDPPKALADAKYDVAFPWSPLYVGYSQDGFTQHQTCKFPMCSADFSAW